MFDITISDLDAIQEAIKYIYNVAKSNIKTNSDLYELDNCYTRVNKWILNKKIERFNLDKVISNMINVDSGTQFTIEEMKEVLNKLHKEI